MIYLIEAQVQNNELAGAASVDGIGGLLKRVRGAEIAPRRVRSVSQTAHNRVSQSSNVRNERQSVKVHFAPKPLDVHRQIVESQPVRERRYRRNPVTKPPPKKKTQDYMSLKVEHSLEAKR